MALGGGTWTGQDKLLPGTYINFANPMKSAGALSERGTVMVPMSLTWGPENTVFTVEAEDAAEQARALFGYGLSAPELTHVRELFVGAKKLLCYRLENGGLKAKNSFCTARHGGTRGNSLTTVIESQGAGFVVYTVLDGFTVDMQQVSNAAQLKPNKYVDFNLETTLTAVAGLALTGGTQGAAVSTADYERFLTAAEGYSYHILCCPSGEKEIVQLFAQYTKEQVENSGAGFQLVCYRPEKADWEGIIAVQNAVLSGLPEWGLVYWVAGVQAACPLNQSLTGRIYGGSLTLDIAYSQAQLKAGVAAGGFYLHGVEGEARVLRDVNSLVTFAEGKGADFAMNQTVRVCSSLGGRIAALFSGKYLGTVANDEGGRISLWNDICRILQEYQDAHAITEFQTEDVEVLPGDKKKNVVCRMKQLAVAGAMEALYMNIVIV